MNQVPFWPGSSTIRESRFASHVICRSSVRVAPLATPAVKGGGKVYQRGVAVKGKCQGYLSRDYVSRVYSGCCFRLVLR